MAVLGLDLGTSSCKAAAFSSDGRLLAATQRLYRLHQPKSGWAELDPEHLWLAVCEAVSWVVENLPEPIVAIAISSQGEGVVPVDDHGEALGPFIVSFDRRSLRQAERLREAVGERMILEITGHVIHPMASATKILWLKENVPAIAQQAAYYLCAGDFITFRLGLPPVTDPSMAARTMLYDVQRHEWSVVLLEAVGIDTTQLAHVQPSGTPIGQIPPKWTKALGLAGNVTVVVGGHDQLCAALGAGSVEEGDVTYSLGTTEALVYPLYDFRPDLVLSGFPCYPHVIRNRYVTLAGTPTGGNLLQWFQHICVEAEGNRSYSLLADMEDEPTDLFVLPHFTGTGTPWNDPNGVGAIIGLHLATTRGQLVRALLEGVTYEILLNIHRLAMLGAPLSVCRVVGGGAQVQRLVQLKADILGRQLIVPSTPAESACRGAALLAAQGAGLINDAVLEVKQWIQAPSIVEPHTEYARVYADKYRTYELLYPLLKSGWVT